MPDDPTPPPLPRPVIPIDEPAEGVETPQPAAAPPAYPPPVHAQPAYPPPATYPPPAYPPPAQYPPAAAYPPPAQYPPTAATAYPPAASPYTPADAPAAPPYPPQSGYPAWPPPVDYRTSGVGGYSRPGFVTTLAVFAIITAALSFLASAFTGCSSMIVYGGAQRGGTSVMRVGRPAPPAVTPGPAVAPPSPNGLSPADASVITVVLRNRATRGMSSERQRQVQAFFAEHGKLVIEDPAGPLTSRKVYEHLGQFGQEYASAGATGADFFDFKAGPLTKMPGRLRVFDDRAVFDPEDHSATLRASAGSGNAAAGAPGANVTPDEDQLIDAGLDPNSAAAVVNQIRMYSNNTLNAAQAATLSSTLQSPGYSQWVSPSSTIPGLTAQVKSVFVQRDGSMAITFVMGKVTLDKQGKVIDGPTGQVAGAATQPVMPGGPVMGLGTVGVSPTSCALAIGEAAFSALLAIYLLVVAILSLRQTPGVRRLFLIYAVAKILLGVVGIVAFAGIIRSINAANDSTGYAQAMAAGFAGLAKFELTIVSLGMIFPVIVLLAMTMNRNVKSYYRAAV